MPRKPRMYLPGVPCHVIQRGNNRETCFFCKRDYQVYLSCLDDACRAYGVALHAYVLMTNHVHLLLTPREATGISRVMQSVGRRYVQFVNHEQGRCGTLWESRHKASLIDAESYLLTCYRYIELNPVKAGLVPHPADYPWSSYRHNAEGEIQERLTPHDIYQRLARSGTSRQQRYRELFSRPIADAEIRAIRNATHFSMPLGSDEFKRRIERALGRRIGQAERGRPCAYEAKSSGAR